MLKSAEQEQLEELYYEYYDILLRFCKRRLEDCPEMRAEAEDLVQDTLLMAVAHYDELVTHENVGGWLMKVCYHKLGNARKRNWVRRSNTSVYLDAAEHSDIGEKRDRLEAWLNRCESDQILSELHRMLTDTENNVFDDYFVNGKKIKEISADRSVSIPAVKKALHRIREKARRIRDKITMIRILLRVSFAIRNNCIK